MNYENNEYNGGMIGGEQTNKAWTMQNTQGYAIIIVVNLFHHCMLCWDFYVFQMVYEKATT